MRLRLRERDTRMGGEGQTPDQVVDAADQQLEQAAERVEQLIMAAQETAGPLDIAGKATVVEGLEDATQQIEHAVERVETLMAVAPDSEESSTPAEEAAVTAVQQATRDVGAVVERVETALTEAQHDADVGAEGEALSPTAPTPHQPQRQFSRAGDRAVGGDG